VSIIKLQAGESATFTVARVVDVETEDGTKKRFEGTGGESILLSDYTAKRQLERVKLTEASAVGQALRFEKVAKDGKTYINVYKAEASGAKQNGGGNGGAVATGGGNAAPAPASSASPLSGHALYKQITSWVINDVIPLYVDAGIPVDASSVAAMSATLYIQASRNGH
jgi:hypothetical protein